LAPGGSPDASAALSLRAHRLIGPRARSARSIVSLIDDAEDPLGPQQASVPICRCKGIAREEGARRADGPSAECRSAGASGAAKVHLLFNDSSGPVYDRPAAADLEPAIREARLTLEIRV
jgi:hypothetical protein